MTVGDCSQPTLRIAVSVVGVGLVKASFLTGVFTTKWCLARVHHRARVAIDRASLLAFEMVVICRIHTTTHTDKEANNLSKTRTLAVNMQQTAQT